MAKIFLRGQATPIFLQDSRASVLKNDFERNALSGVVRIGDIASVDAKDIRSIVLDENLKIKEKTGKCDVKNCEGNCQWVIVRNDGNAIWKQTYTTKDEAVAEMKMENLFNYGKLEHRFLN